ncbi:MAG: hypothetical protein ACJ8AT_39265 [Hyalangium sp.]|uniref:hypothetical protein n=1 Tax=Hyalangium sp. TaxID=2028555 RepID=UPI003899DBA6
MTLVRSWLGRSNGAPRLILGSNAAWWPKDDLPLNLWVDWGLSSEARPAQLFAAVLSLGRGNFLWPVDLQAETRNAFFANRATFRSAVVIQPYTVTSAPGRFTCTTDIRFDRTSGEMHNALVEWNLYPGDDVGNVARLTHELGHCLGLGHCDGTVMQERVSDWTGLRGFNAEQVKYLNGLRA